MQNQQVKGRQEIGVVSLGIGLGVALEVAVLLLATLVHQALKADGSTFSETAHVQADGERNAAEWVRYAYRTSTRERTRRLVLGSESERLVCVLRARRRARRSAASSS